jgi:hypothetical protein
MNKIIGLRVFAAVAAGMMLAGTANLARAQFLPGGGVDQPNPDLPPAGVYLTPDQVHATYTGANLAIVLDAVQHRPFADKARRTDVPNPAGGTDQIEDFPSDLHGMVSVNGSPMMPFDMQGPVQTLVHGKSATNPTGTFQTEMLQMNLSGTSPFGQIMVRESPTLQSLGETRIMPTGGGNFHVDSFFDVFTELSTDGGQTWIPSQGPSHVNLVPEPSSVVLCGLGLIGIGIMAVRRKTGREATE